MLHIGGDFTLLGRTTGLTLSYSYSRLHFVELYYIVKSATAALIAIAITFSSRLPCEKRYLSGDLKLMF